MRRHIMKRIVNDLIKLIKFLQSIKNDLQATVTNLQGHLKTCKINKYYKYYLREGKKYRYLKKSEIGVAQALVQQEFENNLIKAIEKIIESASSLIPLISESPWSHVVHRLPPAKRVLVKMPAQIDARHTERWLSKSVSVLDIKPEDLICPSLKGKLFRSKSEATIADYLDENNIIYIYERKLVLSSGIVYPDFTIYLPATKRIIIWEHFGRMDDLDYFDKTSEKINDYETNGFNLGSNFFCTFESKRSPLNKNVVKSIIARIIEDNTWDIELSQLDNA